MDNIDIEIAKIVEEYENVDCGEQLIEELVDVLNKNKSTFYDSVDALSYLIISIAMAHKNKDSELISAVGQLLRELSVITTNKLAVKKVSEEEVKH